MPLDPKDWYAGKKREYRERFHEDWTHLSMYGEKQDSYCFETAMRSGLECKILEPTSPDEIEMIVNGMIIREILDDYAKV